MVAGVPMMNGSETVEGFVPTRDATVVTRLLAAGATITGKAVCEDLCFSGVQLHLPHRRRSSTRGTRPARRAGRRRAARRWWRPAPSTWPSAVTRAARSGSRAPSAAPSATSRPTGLVPYTGAFPIELTIDHLGPMTRTVADAALDAQRDGRRRRPRPPPAGRHRRPTTTSPLSGRRRAGLRIGMVRRGVRHRRSPTRASTTPCGRRSRRCGAPGWPSTRCRCRGTPTRCTSGT